MLGLTNAVKVDGVLRLGFTSQFHADKAQEHLPRIAQALGPVAVDHLAVLDTALELGGKVEWR